MQPRGHTLLCAIYSGWGNQAAAQMPAVRSDGDLDRGQGGYHGIINPTARLDRDCWGRAATSDAARK